MNEDVFNASLRKFLKKVGITSQREIEKACATPSRPASSRAMRSCRQRWC
jgi:hypothetical protein